MISSGGKRYANATWPGRPHRADPPCHLGWVAMTALAIALSDFGTSRASWRLRSGPAKILRSNVLR